MRRVEISMVTPGGRRGRAAADLHDVDDRSRGDHEGLVESAGPGAGAPFLAADTDPALQRGHFLDDAGRLADERVQRENLGDTQHDGERSAS
jgi:hypothetical protein